MIDETIVGLHLDGEPPPPPVAAFDPSGETVITIGSMSKAFWAGLRIGWIRANPALIGRLAAARAALDISSPVLEQLIAVELLANAEAVMARQREAARARRDAFAAALRAELPEWRFAVPAGGLSLWVELDAPRSTALAAIADRYGLRLAAGPRFGVDGAFERFLRLPFSLPGAGAGGGRRRASPSPGARSATRRRSPPMRPRARRLNLKGSDPFRFRLPDARNSPAGSRVQVRGSWELAAAQRRATMDFHALFDAQYVPVHRYLAHRLGDPAAAEDLAAETFLRAYAARASFRPGSPRAWLFTIATNLLRDHARGAGRRDAAFAEWAGQSPRGRGARVRAARPAARARPRGAAPRGARGAAAVRLGRAVLRGDRDRHRRRRRHRPLASGPRPCPPHRRARP